MRNEHISNGSGLGRIVAVVLTGMLWTAGNVLAAGPGAVAPGGGGHAAGGGGGGEASRGGTGNGGTGNGGTSSAGTANSGTAKSSASNQQGTGQSVANRPSAEGQRANRNDLRNSEFNNGVWYGSPWSPYAYGWGSDSYSDNDGTFSQATFTDSSAGNNTGTSAPSPSPATVTQPLPPSAASVAAQQANAVDKSPEMIAANNTVQSAQAAYVTERGRALSALAGKSEYQQALDRKHNAVKVLEKAKSTGESQPAVIEAATEKLDAGDEVTKMREEAVVADPGASAAKERLTQAIADRDSLRAKLLAQH